MNNSPPFEWTTLLVTHWLPSGKDASTYAISSTSTTFRTAELQGCSEEYTPHITDRRTGNTSNSQSRVERPRLTGEVALYLCHRVRARV